MTHIIYILCVLQYTQCWRQNPCLYLSQWQRPVANAQSSGLPGDSPPAEYKIKPCWPSNESNALKVLPQRSVKVSKRSTTCCPLTNLYNFSTPAHLSPPLCLQHISALFVVGHCYSSMPGTVLSAIGMSTKFDLFAYQIPKKIDHFPRIWTASFVQHGEYVSYIHLQGLSTLSTNKLLGVNYSWFINQSESLLFLPRVVSCPCLPCEICARSASSSTWFLEAAELGVFQVRSMRSISGGVVNPIISLPFGDDIYHPSIAIVGMVYRIGFPTLYRYNNIYIYITR